MKRSKNSSFKSVLILILALVIVVLFVKNRSATIKNTETASKEMPASTSSPISITTIPIKEANYTGSRIKINGTSNLAVKAEVYVDQAVADFANTANQDVPDLRQKFGADSPTSEYTIDLTGKYVKSSITESIIITQNIYTGGAHGITLYKVFTASIKDGNIMSLSQIIKPSEQAAFVSHVKKSLLAWKPEGMDSTVVFPDDVNALTFDSFENWSLDDKNLTIYFDQDSIGPSVIGAVAYPLPLGSIEKYLEVKI